MQRTSDELYNSAAKYKNSAGPAARDALRVEEVKELTQGKVYTMNRGKKGNSQDHFEGFIYDIRRVDSIKEKAFDLMIVDYLHNPIVYLQDEV